MGPDGARPADVLISGEHVEAIGDLDPPPGAQVIDARRMLVIPGAVDAHTHLDMNVGAVRSADDFVTGTTAAACGGTTTVVDFATAYRGETVAQGLAKWHSKAEGRALVDYSFHMTITELTRPAEDIVAEMAEQGITSFKLYMTYPGRLMVSDEVISEMLRAAGRVGSLVCLHCEDDAVVSSRRAQALERRFTEPRWHAWSRPPSAEADAVARAARMAEEAEAACYVVHLSSAPALAEVRAARERGLNFYAETCPQYLYLSAERYEEAPQEAARYVCAPPLRDGWHQEELWEGLRAGHLQVVSTDHCPFTAADKSGGLSGGGWKDFTEIPGGMPGLETRLALIYQRVTDGDMTPEQWVESCCTAPAKLFGLHPRKGELTVGADADIVVFDPSSERPLVPERLHMNLDYSPYAHLVMRGWPSHVLVRGHLVARDGEPVGDAGWGKFIARGPSGTP
ncbi:MAG: dihydropyrimidinase [Actinobacteria bacterium]|nr:dihydropyrimidinase [Actinomycetota bacterium]